MAGPFLYFSRASDLIFTRVASFPSFRKLAVALELALSDGSHHCYRRRFDIATPQLS